MKSDSSFSVLSLSSRSMHFACGPGDNGRGEGGQSGGKSGGKRGEKGKKKTLLKLALVR